MDDSRIKALTEDVLEKIRSGAPGAGSPGDLESRVAALEAAVRGLQGGSGTRSAVAAVVVSAVHPSQALLGVAGGGGGQCVMEPDKPCVQSGACRTFGH
jgi:hypothetical protein